MTSWERFPEKEWIAIWEDLCLRPFPSSISEKLELIQEAFYRFQLDSPYAEENLVRLTMAYDFLKENLSCFEREKLLVTGEGRVLVQKELMGAVGVIFTAMPLSMLEDIGTDAVLVLLGR